MVAAKKSPTIVILNVLNSSDIQGQISHNAPSGDCNQATKLHFFFSPSKHHAKKIYKNSLFTHRRTINYFAVNKIMRNFALGKKIIREHDFKGDFQYQR
jgi:hypothetical protein